MVRPQQYDSISICRFLGSSSHKNIVAPTERNSRGRTLPVWLAISFCLVAGKLLIHWVTERSGAKTRIIHESDCASFMKDRDHAFWRPRSLECRDDVFVEAKWSSVPLQQPIRNSLPSLAQTPQNSNVFGNWLDVVSLAVTKVNRQGTLVSSIVNFESSILWHKVRDCRLSVSSQWMYSVVSDKLRLVFEGSYPCRDAWSGWLNRINIAALFRIKNSISISFRDSFEVDLVVGNISRISRLQCRQQYRMTWALVINQILGYHSRHQWLLE